MQELLAEAAHMPDAAIRVARGISEVRTPEKLVPLREHVLEKHRGALHQLFAAIDERYGTTGARTDYVNVFYAAGEMAVMEMVGRQELSPADRRTLRDLWEHLLYAT
jgi:hypothetical protein